MTGVVEPKSGTMRGEKRPTENVSVFGRYTEAGMMAKSYCKTGGYKNMSRYISFVPDFVADMEQNEHPETLKLLVGTQWQVHRVSPMWGLPFLPPSRSGGQETEVSIGTCPNVDRMGTEGPIKYDENALTRLAQVMGEVVGRHAEVKIVPLPGLRGNQFDEEALCVSVSSQMAGNKVDIFMGILCSVEATELRLTSPGATNLPVLLTKGALDVTESVVHGLERCLDCVVGRLELPVKELQWMAAMWAGLEEGTQGSKPDSSNLKKSSEEKGNVVKLVYGLSASLAKEVGMKIDHLTFEFSAQDMREIWRCCRDREAELDFTETEMTAFHR
jgi:hypothetical protein